MMYKYSDSPGQTCTDGFLSSREDARDHCEACSNRYVTFRLSGQLNNHLRQLENVVEWAQRHCVSVMLPARLSAELVDDFDLSELTIPQCIIKFNGSLNPCAITATVAWKRSLLLNSTASDAGLLNSTLPLYRALFSVPKTTLVRAVGCAMQRIGKTAQNTSLLCTQPMAISFQRQRLQYAALHLRGMDGNCQARLRARNITTEYCRMDPVWVQQQFALQRSPCAALPLYIATDWQAPHAVNLLLKSKTMNASVMHRDKRHIQLRKSTKVWVDIFMLAMSSCTLLNPASSFTQTVSLLKLAFGS